MFATKLHIHDYLESYKFSLLESWSKKIIVSPNDPYQGNILKNGEMMYSIIQKAIMIPYEEMKPHIELLAKRVAEERVASEINIGEFVYNVSIGRSEIFHQLYKLDFKDKHSFLQEIFDNINLCFDWFLYCAVSHYDELKDKIIEEKKSFINQSHKDRLTLLGQMTSSFIHEFRNPLTSIQGFVQLLRSDHPTVPYLDIIAGEIEQLNFRISQFLLLSKKELIGKEKGKIDLQLLIEEILSFLYPSLLGAKVEVFKQLQIDTYIYGYQDELRQVFMNILFNAIDVLQNYRPDPKIYIQSYTYDNQVIVKLSNNGPAIPPALLQTIFEPFVTTKQLGTGLGLFVCKEIIEKHKGVLECISNLEETTFKMTFPIHP
ncbi:signal transduction histidine kinase [Bacillus oleivorans]|uniref:histidine kinase n=1 Tax=Bacillus oleivorans TaxID=1448271 RepID=A0A285CSG1_9BACI|nr:histidine kinase N-terminal domain-containing protein [Bacillus oleivorans]SNX69978.1 signal transduction histidine kinase [Bacillus oleivorans]